MSRADGQRKQDIFGGGRVGKGCPRVSEFSGQMRCRHRTWSTIPVSPRRARAGAGGAGEDQGEVGDKTDDDALGHHCPVTLHAVGSVYLHTHHMHMLSHVSAHMCTHTYRTTLASLTHTCTHTVTHPPCTFTHTYTHTYMHTHMCISHSHGGPHSQSHTYVSHRCANTHNSHKCLHTHICTLT